MPWIASILFIEANKVGKNTASVANRALSSESVFRVCGPMSRLKYLHGLVHVCYIFSSLILLIVDIIFGHVAVMNPLQSSLPVTTFLIVP
jgi:hypothetical protein